jgi:hypothetical protein
MAMEHWRLAYLGMRRIPRDLSEFELATFFTFSSKERALLNARPGPLYRLALALHIGFVRMTGATLDAYQYVPQILWSHLGKQFGIATPDIGTLRTLGEPVGALNRLIPGFNRDHLDGDRRVLRRECMAVDATGCRTYGKPQALQAHQACLQPDAHHISNRSGWIGRTVA